MFPEHFFLGRLTLLISMIYLSPKNPILEVNYVVIGNFGHILGDLSSLPRLRRRLGAG